MRRALKLANQLVSSTCADECRTSFFSSSRGLLVNIPVLVKDSFSEPCNISYMRSISTASEPLSVPGQPSKVYVAHHFYKAKTALCMQPIAPEFSLLDSGALKLSKEGAVLLSFAPAVARLQYDWEKKQVFALSVAELGTLLSLGPNEHFEFFHDPFKGKSDTGKVSKVLQVTPTPKNPGYFFNLRVSNKIENNETHFNIPITKAEFTVMHSAFNFILPYLMGLHAFANSIKPYEPTKVPLDNSEMHLLSDRKWDE